MGCYVLLRDCFILLLPCHLGALLWPLQLRQQAVYANHSPSVLRHIALSLTVGWFSLLPRPRGISLESRDLFRPILLYCVILCCVRGYRRRGSLPPLLALDCPSCWPFGQALARPFVCARVVVLLQLLRALLVLLSRTNAATYQRYYSSSRVARR